MKAVRITNPLWLGQIGPRVAEYVKKVEIAGVSYETLYNYLAQSIQLGGDNSEFWVVYDNEEAVAFGHFVVKGMPYHGMVSCDNLYKWTKKNHPVDILTEKFIEFGKSRRSPIYEVICPNEKVFEMVERMGGKRGYAFTKQGGVGAIGRKEV